MRNINTNTHITTIGIDLAKTVFQIHGCDKAGVPVLKKRLRRGQLLSFIAGLEPCLIGLEACGSAHYWAREFKRLGHEVRMISPQFVKPFVKTNKNDAVDAEAIVEAMLRPTMRFVTIKSEEQQSTLMLHRSRELLVHQKTQLINAIRGHCTEFGLVVAQGASRVGELVAIIDDPNDDRLPASARVALSFLTQQLSTIKDQLKRLEAELKTLFKQDEAAQRLETIPGIGLITATALVATIGDGSQFKSGRELAAWLGLVPRHTASGNKQRLGRISKRGDGYLRRLLVHGARTVLRWRQAKDNHSPWLKAMLQRRPTNVVLVAMANKVARVVWALLTKNETYRPHHVSAK